MRIQCRGRHLQYTNEENTVYVHLDMRVDSTAAYHEEWDDEEEHIDADGHNTEGVTHIQLDLEWMARSFGCRITNLPCVADWSTLYQEIGDEGPTDEEVQDDCSPEENFVRSHLSPL